MRAHRGQATACKCLPDWSVLVGRGAIFLRKPCVSPVCTQSLKNQIIQKTAEVTLQDALPVFPRTKTTAISE